jgi:membrane dipeptidase
MRLLPLLLALGLSMPAMAADDAAMRHARTLLSKVPLVDGHNDLPWSIRDDKDHPGDVHGYDLHKPTTSETDLPRMKKGMVSAQFWSVYVPGEMKGGFAKTQLEQLDLARRMIARYPKELAFATRSSDIAKAKQQGRIASFIGMEGGHVIENSLGALRAYYDLGARYMTLTHNVTLDWADAALGERKHGGLTPFGREVVREMNRLGMMVDLSHVSPEVMAQAMEVSEAPVIFSHSSSHALVPHPRNVPDSILAKLKVNGGVIMVTYVPPFVSKDASKWAMGLMDRLKGIEDEATQEAVRKAYESEVGPSPKATLTDVANHIDYIAKLAGKDHIGIAADFCCGKNPVGLEDVSTYPALFAELIRRGWKDDDLKKLAGGNIIRTFAQVERVAAQLQKVRQPGLAKP